MLSGLSIWLFLVWVVLRGCFECLWCNVVSMDGIGLLCSCADLIVSGLCRFRCDLAVCRGFWVGLPGSWYVGWLFTLLCFGCVWVCWYGVRFGMFWECLVGSGF